MSDVPRGAESPLKQYLDAFDVEHIDWKVEDYTTYAIQQNKSFIQLLLQDWHWRAAHKQNVIASAEGEQGSGKSLFLSGASLLCSKIYGKEFYDKQDISVLKNHLSFDPEDLDRQLGNSEERETFLNDEDRKANVGVMSNMVSANIVDYEEQLRKHQNNLFFASPELQDHKHFFVFEMKHIVFDETGFPKATVAMLKTKRYTDNKQFVWRGFVSFPVPPKEYLAQYDPLKDEHSVRLKNKYGNTLDPVEFYANKIFKENLDALITQTKEGFIKPIKAELMNFVVAREIGTRKFTTKGYDMLNARLKQLIIETYADVNRKKEADLIAETERIKEERRKRHEDEMKEAEKKRQAKMKMLELKLEEERRKNDLKEKALQIKEKDVKRKIKKGGK